MIQIFSVLRVLLLITVNMDHPAIHYSNPPLNNIIHDSKLIKLSDYEKSDCIITYGIIHLFTVYSVFIRTFVSLNYWHHETSIQNDFHKSLKLFCCSLMKKSYYLIIILHRVLQYMAMAHRFERRLSVVAFSNYKSKITIILYWRFVTRRPNNYLVVGWANLWRFDMSRWDQIIFSWWGERVNLFYLRFVTTRPNIFLMVGGAKKIFSF